MAKARKKRKRKRSLQRKSTLVRLGPAEMDFVQKWLDSDSVDKTLQEAKTTWIVWIIVIVVVWLFGYAMRHMPGSAQGVGQAFLWVTMLAAISVSYRFLQVWVSIKRDPHDKKLHEFASALSVFMMHVGMIIGIWRV